MFGSVEKLQTKNLDNGTDTWVPEDEANLYADTTVLKIDRNGTYNAPVPAIAGYHQVIAEIPTGLDAENAGNVIEQLKTNITKYALIPNITVNGKDCKWNGGVKTFKTTSSAKFSEYINISETHERGIAEVFVPITDYQNIAESDTELLKINNKQIYFISIADFSKGFTTISPKVYNKTLDSEIVDMYTCRRIKVVAGSDKMLWDLQSQVAENRVSTDLNFNDRANLKYTKVDETGTELKLTLKTSDLQSTEFGVIVLETADGGTDVFIRKANKNFVMYPIEIYNTYEEAEEQSSIGSCVGVLIGGKKDG